MLSNQVSLSAETGGSLDSLIKELEEEIILCSLVLV